MNIDIVCVGKIKERYLKDAIAEYSKRLTRFTKISIIEVADEKTPEHASDAVNEQIKAKEGDRILKHLRDNATVVALAIEGKQLTSEQLAAHRTVGPAWREPCAVRDRRLTWPRPARAHTRRHAAELFEDDVPPPAHARDSARAGLPRIQDQRARAVPQITDTQYIYGGGITLPIIRIDA